VTEKSRAFLEQVKVSTQITVASQELMKSERHMQGNMQFLSVQPLSRSAVSLVRHAADLRKISLHNTLSQRS
jgi:hypothetical protein